MKKINQHRKLNRKINKAVNKALASLLYPKIQIWCANELEMANPFDAGYDIKADLYEVKEKFLSNAEFTDVPTVDSNGVVIPDTFEKGIVVHPGGQFLCPTGIYTSFDFNHSADIQPRSGLSLKKKIMIRNSPGLIDCTFRNEWGIILVNGGDSDFIVRQNDPVAQVVFRIVCHPEFIKVDTLDELEGPDRGGGFGHSSEKLFR